MADKAFEMKDGKVVIFKNTKRENESHPEYRGKICINGEVSDISLWVKTTKHGEKYFSGSYTKEWKPAPKQEPVYQQQAKYVNNNFDLPF